MDRDTARQRIQNGLGFSTTLADTIVLRMQESQRDLERGKTLPKFLLLEDQTLTLAQGASSVALPDDFLRRSNTMPRYTPTGTDIPTTIPWRNWDELRETLLDSDPAGPKGFVLRNDTIYFLPVADIAYTVTWDYYQKDALLTSNIENLWLANAPELIIGDAGMRIALDKRDKDAVALFTQMYKQARQSWFGETVEQEMDDGPMLLGANA